MVRVRVRVSPAAVRVRVRVRARVGVTFIRRSAPTSWTMVILEPSWMVMLGGNMSSVITRSTRGKAWLGLG